MIMMVMLFVLFDVLVELIEVYDLNGDMIEVYVFGYFVVWVLCGLLMFCLIIIGVWVLVLGGIVSCFIDVDFV